MNTNSTFLHFDLFYNLMHVALGPVQIVSYRKKKRTSTGIKRQWMTTNLRMPKQFSIQFNSIHLSSDSNNTFKLILHPYTNIYP